MTVALIVPAMGLLKLAGLEIPSECATYDGWRMSTQGLKMKRFALLSVERGMRFSLNKVTTILDLLRKLRNVETSVRETWKFAVEKLYPVVEVMVGMGKKLDLMKSVIFDLDREIANCDDDRAQFGHSAARKNLIKFLSLDR